MGFLDRLKQIGSGVADMVLGPIGVPIDLVRSFPDQDISLGSAFTGGMEQTVEGLAEFSQGTGLSAIGGGLAEHTPIDDILGRVMIEADLFYNTELQVATGQAPLGLRSIPGIDPGDISISRVAGAAVGGAAAALPAGEPAGRGISEAWNRTDPRYPDGGFSPGQMAVANTIGYWNMDEQSRKELEAGIPWNLTTGTMDAFARWYLQPEVIGGKGIKKVRARWSPDVARIVETVRKKTGFNLAIMDDAALRGGALNMQLENPTGQPVYHVTRTSNLEDMQVRGVMRVPDGADPSFTANQEFMDGVEVVRHQVPDLIDDTGALTPSRAIPQDEADEIFSAMADIEERIGLELGDVTEVTLKPATETWALARKIFGGIEPEQLTKQEALDLIALASNQAEAKAMALAIHTNNVAYMMNDVWSSQGLTRPGTPVAPQDKAIYLLGEDELPEAYRYSAALYKANPDDPPVIIKMNPEGLPVIYDDFTQPHLPDARSGLSSDASLVTSVDKIEPKNIIEVIRPVADDLEVGSMGSVLRGGADVPGYLEPGGRVHNRLFNPDNTPVEPGQMMRFDDIDETYRGMVEAFNSDGSEGALPYARATLEKRRGIGPQQIADEIASDKRFQHALNDMENKTADEIRRTYFADVPGGATVASMLAEHSDDYMMRRHIVMAAMGIAEPDVVTMGPILHARMKALTKDLDDFKVSPEYRRAQKALHEGMVDEVDQATMGRYEELQESVADEIDALKAKDETVKWMKDIQKFGGVVRTPPRFNARIASRERLRRTAWYQDSPLARPIRAVVEKEPHRWLNTHDPNGDVQIVRQLEQAQPLGISRQKAAGFRDRYMATTTEAEKLQVVLQVENEIIRAAAKRAGLKVEQIEDLISHANRGKATVAEMLKSRRYGPDGIDVIEWFDATDGTFNQMPMPLLGTQLQNWIPLSNVKEIIRQSTKVRRLVNRGVTPPREILDSFYNLWKPSVLLRGGWPVRVVSDEQLRILAQGSGLVSHLAAIEAGPTPPWGLSNIFGKGVNFPQRMAGTFALPISIVTSGSVRAAKGVSRAGRKLHAINPKRYEYMLEAGIEKQASARASFTGPDQTILAENAALVGITEAGIMDHLITHGKGNWTTVSINHRQGFSAWKRALQDQIGRDPLARIFLEGGGEGSTKYAVVNPSYAAYRSGIARKLDVLAEEGLFVRPDNIDELLDELADEVFREYGMRRGVDPTILDDFPIENQIEKIVHRRIDFDDPKKLDGDYRVIAEQIADDVDNWTDAVVSESGDFARQMVDGTLEPEFLGTQLSQWFDGVFSDDWMNDPVLVNLYNVVALEMSDVKLSGVSDAASDIIKRRVFAEYSRVEPEDINLMIDDLQDMWSESFSMAKQIEMSGGDTARIKAKIWLTSTDEGRQYASRLPWRKDFDKWLDEVDELVGYYTADYNPNLSRAALDLKVNREVLESIDEAIRPPTVHAEVIEQSLGNSVISSFVSDLTASSFDLLGRLPTDTLSRQPFFRQIFADEMMRIEKILKAQGVEMTEEVFQKAGQQARNYAIYNVKTYLYDLAETSRFGHMMRFWMPFFPAWQEVIEVWSKIAWQNPEVLGRAALIWRAPNKAGLITTDDEGNEFLTFRLSEKVTNAMGLEGWHKYIAEGGVRFGKQSFNMVTNSPLPSIGPPLQIPINEVVKNKPELEEALKYLLPYGVKANSLQVMLSPIVRRGSALINGPEGDTSYQRDFSNALMWLDWRFRTGESTTPPTYEEAHEIARKIFTVRTFANVTAPAQPIFDSPLKPYIDIYRELQETQGPEKADETFLNQYGAEFFAVTLSRTVSQTGIPPTVEGQAARDRMQSLITKYPDFGRLIIGEEASIGDFSSAAFAAQLTTPPTPDPKFFGDPDRTYRKLTLDPETGSIEEVDRRVGWNEYIKLMDMIDLERKKRGLPNLRVKEAEDLVIIRRVMTADLAKKYPAWFRDLNERDDLKWSTRIKTMRDISTVVLKNEDRPDMQGVADYLEARSVIVQELNHRKQTGGSATLDATANQDLAFIWEALVNQIVDGNIFFQPLYYRYLEGDPVEINSG